MRSTEIKFILFFCFIAASGCKAEKLDFESMELSEKQFNDKQSDLVVNMPLDEMFSDKQVRLLAESAGKGQVDRVSAIVSTGVSVNFKGKNGVTPLFWSMRNFDGFKRLLELGADPNVLFSGSSVMHWAARHKDTRFLSSALDHGGNPNLEAGKFNETPLFKTIGVKGGDNQKAMKLLLDSGAKIDAVTGGEKVFGMSMGGKTPVLVAADLGRFDTVYELLIRGANFGIEDDSGRDLVSRIVSMNGRFPAGSEQEKSLNQVIEFLIGRGVEVPNA